MADNFYEVTLTNGTVLGEVFDAVVANNGTETSLTSLALIRRGANAYAEPMSLSLVHMLENFANGSQPSAPLTGQLWYDTTAKKIKVYDPTNSGFTSIDGTGLATGLVNAVTIAVTGDAIGETSFDATSNVAINVEMATVLSNPGTYFAPLMVVDAKGRITSLTANAGIISNAGGVITGNLTLTNNASIDVGSGGKVKEAGFPLIPTGIIVMWSGSTPPAGWVLCDGTTHNVVGGTITTPNLKGKFIVGMDAGGGYTANSTGGTPYNNGVSVSSSGGHIHGVQIATAGAHNHLGSTGSHVLTVAEMPPHIHGIGGNDGFRAVGNDLAYNGAGAGAQLATTKQTASTGNGVGHSHTIASSGDHTHTANTLSSGEHIHTIAFLDNRPPYYVLAYIMKL